MPLQHKDILTSGIFITFSGNCKEALTFYQTCFGGILHFDMFDDAISGDKEPPVISGSLLSDRIIIYGSDLVHDEGRRIGNFLSVMLGCKNADERRNLIEVLDRDKKAYPAGHDEKQSLIEVKDIFDVSWILSII